jgi:hypothetical protein
MMTPMGPPATKGYSLRVQLFSPQPPYETPIRCFRVLTSPELTLREFCKEAARIYELNYDETLPAIKRCQDSQRFDIVQATSLGKCLRMKRLYG